MKTFLQQQTNRRSGLSVLEKGCNENTECMYALTKSTNFCTLKLGATVIFFQLVSRV